MNDELNSPVELWEEKKKRKRKGIGVDIERRCTYSKKLGL